MPRRIYQTKYINRSFNLSSTVWTFILFTGNFNVRFKHTYFASLMPNLNTNHTHTSGLKRRKQQSKKSSTTAPTTLTANVLIRRRRPKTRKYLSADSSPRHRTRMYASISRRSSARLIPWIGEL